ncbi:MAG: M20 family metallo-hydrolase [Syntrophobacterales bacterium]|jgi:succinyl-diaminopimelate desuccinylase|nr:M20 family metallo-hydrolase [Syntrophobacterales bacterium]
MTTTEMFRLLCERLDTYQEQVIELQRQLVSRVALGPEVGGVGETAKAAFLTDLLQSWGLKVHHYPAPDTRVPAGERPNLVVYLPGQSSEKVWVLSHLDVVPPGDLTLWDSDPFTLRVDGDRLYGRGTEDDHHGIVMSLLAVKACLDLKITPPRTIALALVADEETGNDKGLAYLLREHGQLFSPEDLIIVPDAGSQDGTMIEVAEKSILWLKLTLMGKQSHASRPHKAKNTLRAAAHVIVALDGLQREFPLQNPLFRPPMSTFEPTKKEANVPNINTIPGRGVFYLDCRVLPDYDLEQVKARIQAIATEAAGKLGVTVAVEPVQWLPSAPPTAPEAPVVKALQQAVRRVYGREAIPQGIGGGTVAAFFRQRGLPAAVWMTANDGAHQPNEFCYLSHLIGDAKVLAHIALGAD